MKKTFFTVSDSTHEDDNERKERTMEKELHLTAYPSVESCFCPKKTRERERVYLHQQQKLSEKERTSGQLLVMSFFLSTFLSLLFREGQSTLSEQTPNGNSERGMELGGLHLIRMVLLKRKVSLLHLFNNEKCMFSSKKEMDGE